MTTLDERAAILRLLAAERDAAKAAIERVRDLCSDDSPAVTPDDVTRWHNAVYMEGWDDAVDVCWQMVRTALNGGAA